MRVLHVLDHSLPVQSGYAFRSASICHALKKLGLEQTVVTSPKQGPSEITGSDEVTYERVWRGHLPDGVRGQIACVLQTRARLRELIRSEEPDVIHAHSPCLNGLAAAGLGKPVVYEIRSSWEDAAVSSGKTAEGSLRYRMSTMLETSIARKADQVVVLCEGLRNEFRNRGIQDAKLTVVGNAIDRGSFREPNAERVAGLRARYGLERRFVLAFFGSFFAWEGLDTLVRALPIMLRRDSRIAVLLAGSGEEDSALRELVRKLGVAAHVHFAGRVDHDQMPEFYGVADMMVFPRRAIRITEMVTPLKPLEAMHFGCIVAASDVGGHRELIVDGRTGILFPPEDPAALASSVIAAIENNEQLNDIRRRAAAFLDVERSWPEMGLRYLEVYARAIGRRAKAVSEG